MNTDLLPISKSFISAEALARMVETVYGLSNVRCQLITASLRNVYHWGSAYHHAFLDRSLDRVKHVMGEIV